ncbi:MAG: COX15/CtaA family protein [Xanthomonadaceae bacterium]|jgi:cytochrome c oxidase assembly protein subunit 15|nr:COX15/CtaA family protein [Xanthomonadaceae bacterium]
MKALSGNRIAQAALAAVVLCFIVVVLGAYVRLSHAGLGCPDWPGCYGEVTWPNQHHEIDAANQAFPERPVEVPKAWREMLHRFAAGGLILLVLGLALARNGHVPRRRWQILAAPALVVAGSAAYTLGYPMTGLGLLGVALALLVQGAIAWRDLPLGRLAVAIFALILVQALFGKWTVTLKLKPIIVTTHLLGGMTTLSLLLWFLYRSMGIARIDPLPIRRGFVIGGIVLVAIQIALGGWVSANYAALSCGTDWPKCLGQWWPPMDARDAFVLWRGIGVDYEGGVLDGEARTAIQMAHRVFAWVVVAHLVALGIRTLRTPGFGGHGIALLGALALQVGLGIANVVAGLPLWVATGHNFGAALLLAVLIALLARVTPPPAGLAPARPATG